MGAGQLTARRTGPALAALLMVTVAGPALAAGCVPPVDTAALTEGRTLFHVAPGGRDDWSGQVAAPLPDGSDGPLASLSAARDAARASPGRDAILLHSGTYRLSAPVGFGAEDAGLHLMAAPGEAPVLNGGPEVTGWTDEGAGLWSAPLSLPDGQTPGAVFAAGRALVPARHPNLPADPTPRDGWLFAAAPPDGFQSNLGFVARPGDLPALPDTAGLVVTIVGGFFPGAQWGSDTLPVVALDPGTGVVRTEGTDYFFTGEGSRYFLSGRREFLDAPGEWWFDPKAGRLYLIPAGPAGTPPEAITAGVLPTLLQIGGASDMVIAGLDLREGAPQGSGKYGTHTRGGGAIRVESGPGTRILGNRFSDLGVAIHVQESNGVEIRGNDIARIAGNGIYLGTAYGSFGRSDDAVVVGNTIRDVGQTYFETAGIWSQASDRFRFEDNLIRGAAQFGIAAGSIWGAQDASHDGLIAGNRVDGANRDTADGGAIKLMGEQADPQRITIRGNIVTRTGGLMNRPDGSFWPEGFEDATEWPTPISWAVYLDGKASGNTIEGNLFSGNVAAIGINGGWSNTVTGNTVLDGTGTAVRIDDATGRDWLPDWAEPNRIADNDFVVTRPDGRVVDIHAPGHGLAYVDFAGNRYRGGITRQSFSVQPPAMLLGRFGGFRSFQSIGQEHGGSVNEVPARALPGLPPLPDAAPVPAGGCG
jgi:parallel beta-helix repeat protein